MKYSSGSAFRRALEDRLRTHHLQTSTPLVRLRKMIAFDRFLARLIQNEPDDWVLKGGFALQLRIGESARTTKDIDVLALHRKEDVYSSLQQAGTLVLDDWFMFEVEPPKEEEEFGGQRYQLNALLDSRPFEFFHIDVGVGDPLLEKPDQIHIPNLLSFAEIKPTVIPCYPVSQQIAEKLHAYTRLHISGESSRVKDLIDMLLLASLGELEGHKLQNAIEATFEERATHDVPLTLPNPPTSWERPYLKMADEVNLKYSTLDEAFLTLKIFLDPVLSGKIHQIWDPEHWEWK